MKLSALAVARPVTTCMFFLAVLVLGLMSLSRLTVDQLPDVVRPSISVLTTYEGAAPEIVERQVTEPLERALATIAGVHEIRSASYENGSSITLDFAWGTNIDLALLEVRERVNDVLRFLPEGVEPPRIRKYDPASRPIVYLNLEAVGPVSPVTLRQYADNLVRYQLQQVPGVAAVDVWGGDEREIQVLVDRSRLEATGLSLQQVVAAVQAENAVRVGGHLASGHLDYVVRPLGEFRSLEDLALVPLRHDGAAPLLLKDVAEVRDGIKERLTQTRVNRAPGLVLAVRKQSGANTVAVSDRIRAKLPQLRRQLPPTLRLHLLFDRATFIRRSLARVEQSALLGGSIAALVLFFFLRSLRPTLIVALAMPLAVVATFILLYLADISLNWMSLGGLALGVGMLVDNAVVVLENIFRHRQQGAAPRRAAVAGSQEVGLALVASTLTTLCVFLPLVYVEGLMGLVFQELALTVAFSLLASLVVSLTLVPMLCARWLGPLASPVAADGLRARLHGVWQGLLEGLERGYRTLLARLLRYRLVVIGMSLALLGASLTLYGRLGSELLPAVDEGMMYIFLELPVGTRHEITDRLLATLEQTVYETVPDVQAMFSRSGLSPWGGGGTHTGFMWVRLRDRAQRRQPLSEIVQALRQRLAGHPDATVRIVERPSDVARLLGASRSERLEIDVFGFDLQQGRQLAQTLAERVQAVAGVASVRLSTEESRPEVQLAIDRRKAAALGIRVREILQAVETSLAGTVASTYREGQYEYDIRVRLREADRQQLADLERVVVLAPGGQRVPLRSLVAVQPGRGPITIQRRGQERVITVQVGLSGERDFGSVAAEVERLLAAVPVPEGFHVVVAGERQEQRAATRNAVFTIVLAVLLVYMIMAALFESLLQPLIMLCTVPFALIGVLVVLWLTGTRVSMPVYIGTILLVGIAVNNGIVMVDYINRLRQQGLAVLAATVQGAATRLRPVLITTLTTVLALIPMALGLGEGGEVWAPLGRVVVGGLTVATLFTLFFVPALYSLLEEARAARRQVAVAVPEVPAAVPE